MYRSKKCNRPGALRAAGFTLPEAVGAVLILAMVGSGVVVVINRSVSTAADLTLRMRAFEVARNNMERILTKATTKEELEYGSSELYPDIAWRNVIEIFNEPLEGRMWLRAVCTAEYTDTQGQPQTVELTHWLSPLTDEQVQKVTQAKQQAELQMADNLIATVEEAANYAQVDPETIQQWLDNGMRTTPSGFFLIPELELYKATGGNPTIADRLFFQAQQHPDQTDLNTDFEQELSSERDFSGVETEEPTDMPEPETEAF